MNIDELATKYARLRGMAVYTCHEAIRGALTEQAEAFKGELQAYDGMVRELTKTVDDMRAEQSVAVDSSETACTEADGCPTEKSVLQRFWRAAQSVPAVGEPVAWVNAVQLSRVRKGYLKNVYLHGESGREIDNLAALYLAPTNSITAAELATLREKAARLEHELEVERMRLAACGVIAMANTVDAAAKARDMLPEYWSASAQDCASAVDREMDYRSRLAVTERERDELRKALQEIAAMDVVPNIVDTMSELEREMVDIASAAIAQEQTK